MLVSVGELIWGAIGLATLALVMTLIAVAWELRNAVKVAAMLALQVEKDLSPTLQDVHHILSRLDHVSAVVEDKVEDTAHLVESLEESLIAGRLRARDAWDDTRVWLDSLRVGWHAGMAVIRDGHGEPDGARRE